MQSHFKELILEHAPPPPAIAEYATANLIKMGFPQRAAESSVAICTCHEEAKTGGGYTCPRCKVRVCELPTECRICGLTLISSPHLARSYHHLFPIVPFDEVAPSTLNSTSHTCFGCQQSLLSQGKFLQKGSQGYVCFHNFSTWSIYSFIVLAYMLFQIMHSYHTTLRAINSNDSKLIYKFYLFPEILYSPFL